MPPAASAALTSLSRTCTAHAAGWQVGRAGSAAKSAARLRRRGTTTPQHASPRPRHLPQQGCPGQAGCSPRVGKPRVARAAAQVLRAAIRAHSCRRRLPSWAHHGDGVVQVVEQHRVCAQRGRQPRQHGVRIGAAQAEQAGAQGAQVGVQGGQAVAEPPAGAAARLELALLLRGPDVHRHLPPGGQGAGGRGCSSSYGPGSEALLPGGCPCICP